MNNKAQYRCTRGGSDAHGWLQKDNRFCVIAGSRISPATAPSFDCASKSYSRLRSELICTGVIVDSVFCQDFLFSSPSAAAAVVTGTTISWKAAWSENIPNLS